MATIIGLSGKRGVGKDLLGSYLEKYGFVKMPFAEELKRRVREDLGLDKIHTDGYLKEVPTNYSYFNEENWKEEFWTPRRIMIAYGQFYRQFDPLYWVRRVMNRINLLPADARIVIPDVRFVNEARFIKASKGYLVRLDRLETQNIYGGNLIDASETELDQYEEFDYRITADRNMVPEDLEREASLIVDRIFSKV